MGAELRVYRRRIRTVESTRKITKAMELIAASRIVRAQNRMNSARPYARELSNALAHLSTDRTLEHPMFTGVENPRRAGILLVTSDRGLAGGYNANVIKRTNELAERLEGEGREVDRFVIGRKGVAYYRFRNIPISGSWTGFSEQPNFADARGATNAVVAALNATSENEVEVEGETRRGIDELWVVYTRFVNTVSQTPTAAQLSPVQGITDEEDASDDAEREPRSGEGERRADAGTLYEFEPEPARLIAEQPEPARLIAELLPRYISSRIYSALLESATSESAARRRAMKSASDNATDLIRTYTRLANQARQAEITQEISEIVGGADALAATGSEE